MYRPVSRFSKTKLPASSVAAVRTAAGPEVVLCNRNVALERASPVIPVTWPSRRAVGCCAAAMSENTRARGMASRRICVSPPALESSSFDVIQLRKTRDQVIVGALLHTARIDLIALRAQIAIAGVEFIRHVQPFYNPAKRNELLLIEDRVIGEIDENFRGARVGAGFRKG